MPKRVLIVDDEKDALEMYKGIVKKEGYDVDTASSGKEALAKLAAAHFDLVLLDVYMPGMSGKEVAEAIRSDSRFKNLRIAFLTIAELSTMGEELTRKFAPIGYIQKPVGLKAFQAKLRSYFN